MGREGLIRYAGCSPWSKDLTGNNNKQQPTTPKEITVQHKLYAIYDIVAQQLVGQHLVLHKHDASAIRMFNDVALTKGTQINTHPADYRLIALGELREHDGQLLLIPLNEVTLEGSQWLAMQEKTTGADSAATGEPISLADDERHRRMRR